MELWFTERHTPNVKFSIKVDHQLYSGNSEFQRIDVFDSKEFGRFLTLDGYMMLTEKDEFIYHEMITHVPMAVHPNPKNILVIGAGDGGVVRELTRYSSVESIDLVEIDELVVEVSRKFLPMFNLWQIELERLGYANFAKVLNAKDYGVPQNRERIFLVSIRMDELEGLEGKVQYHFPKPFPLEKRLKDVLEEKVDEKYYLSDRMLEYFNRVSDDKSHGHDFKPKDGGVQHLQ